MATESQLRILIVEDDPDTAMLIQESLEDHFGAGVVAHYSSVSAALAVDVDEIDIVLSDMNLPDGTGLELLEKLLERRDDLPVVLVTAEQVSELALEAIQKGAYDYVLKAGNYLFAIPVVVEKSLAMWRTKQENSQLEARLTATLDQVRIKNRQLEEAVQKLEAMAATDPLTGLSNRRAFSQALERSFAEANRYGHDLACIMIDLDGFKQFNDSGGHQRGDELLQHAARVLEANCRRSDVAGRYGGDEFVALLPMTDLPTASRVAERIASEFSQVRWDGSADQVGEASVTLSIGVATLRHSRPVTADTLVAHADHALYRAKQRGKRRIVVYDPAPVDRPAPSHETM